MDLQDTSPYDQADGSGRAVTSSHCDDMTQLESNSLVLSICSKFSRKSPSVHQGKRWVGLLNEGSWSNKEEKLTLHYELTIFTKYVPQHRQGTHPFGSPFFRPI